MANAKIKVSVKTGRKGGAGTLIARVPVAVSHTDKPKQKRRLFQTQAEIVTHLNRGSRPSTFKPRRTR